jgi:hypothetical protein
VNTHASQALATLLQRCATLVATATSDAATTAGLALPFIIPFVAASQHYACGSVAALAQHNPAAAYELFAACVQAGITGALANCVYCSARLLVIAILDLQP